ncbi:hypothetical protein [Wukongibacter baidiensis]
MQGDRIQLNLSLNYVIGASTTVAFDFSRNGVNLPNYLQDATGGAFTIMTYSILDESPTTPTAEYSVSFRFFGAVSVLRTGNPGLFTASRIAPNP